MFLLLEGWVEAKLKFEFEIAGLVFKSSLVPPTTFNINACDLIFLQRMEE